MAPPPGILTSGQVAARLGVSRQTVHRYAKSGALPATKLPSGVFRFRVEDVEGFDVHAVEADTSADDAPAAHTG